MSISKKNSVFHTLLRNKMKHIDGIHPPGKPSGFLPYKIITNKKKDAMRAN